eukprot:949346-Rhodomonas_salina.2
MSLPGVYWATGAGLHTEPLPFHHCHTSESKDESLKLRMSRKPLSCYGSSQHWLIKDEHSRTTLSPHVTRIMQSFPPNHGVQIRMPLNHHMGSTQFLGTPRTMWIGGGEPSPHKAAVGGTPTAPQQPAERHFNGHTGTCVD